MGFEETVMTLKQMAECSHNPNRELRETTMCEAQAKVTWDIAFKAGEQKAVRFFQSHHCGFDKCDMEYQTLKAYLKEQGID